MAAAGLFWGGKRWWLKEHQALGCAGNSCAGAKLESPGSACSEQSVMFVAHAESL